MKNILYISFLVSLLSICFTHSYAQTPDCGDAIDFSWAKTMGSTGNDLITDLLTDSQGNIYITGYYSGYMQIQSTSVGSYGGSDFFLAKLDAHGNLIWVRSGGSPNDDYTTSIALDSNDDIIIMGSYEGTLTFDFDPQKILSGQGNKDIFYAKYSSDGSLLWYKRIGGYDQDIPGKLCVDNSDNIIMTGAFYGSFIIDGFGLYISLGGADNFVVKFNSSGNYLWHTQMISTSDDFGRDVVTDSNNNIYVLGEFYGTIYFDGDSQTSDGGKDIFLLKLNGNGVSQWSAKAGGMGYDDNAGSIAIDHLDNVYFCYGEDRASDKCRVIGYNSYGVNILNFNIGGAGYILPTDITIDNLGDIYLVGVYGGGTDFGDGPESSNGTTNYFLTKYKADGTLNYKHLTGNNFLPSSGSSVFVDDDYKIYAAGWFDVEINLGNSTYYSYGQTDAMLLKYDKYMYFRETVVTSVNCNPSNMCIDITVNGGMSPFTYNWSNGATTEDQCGLTPGNYSVSVIDNTGCEISTSVNVPTPVPPVISLPPSITACPFDSVTLDAGAGFVSYLWNNGRSTQSIDVYSPGIYSVTIVDVNSCSTSAQVNLTKLPNKTLFINDRLYFCDGENAVANIPGYLSYLWSDGTTNSRFETTVEGDYWLKVFDGTCFYYDTLYVRKYPSNPLDLGNDRIICEGDGTLIIAPGTYVNYLWHDGSTSNTYWATGAGTVSLTVVDLNGCKYSSSLNVSTTPRPIVDLGGDYITICTDNGYLLKTNNPYPNTTYLWSTGSTQSEIRVYNSGYYSVTATNTLGGCSVSDYVNITIHPAISVELGDEIMLCEGEIKEITVQGNFISILWSDGTVGSSTFVSGDQEISVIVMDYNGCTATDTVLSVVYPITTPFIGNDTVLCEGDKMYLSPKEDYYGYLWSTGSSMSYIEPEEPGSYSVTVNNIAGCSASTSIYLTSEPKPVINNIDSKPEAIYIEASGGTLPYLYSLNRDSWQSSNMFSDYESGNYTIYVIDKNNCLATQEFVLEKIFRIPNFFTPNSDGYNDYWNIEGLYHFPQAVIKVFDRFGKELFEFGNGSPGWDGTYLGDPLPSDTYWYIVDFGGGSKNVQKGHVTLKR